MRKASDNIRESRRDGCSIIELLCQADSLLRDELRIQLYNDNNLEIGFLLEAQLNISRAIEALYDRASTWPAPQKDTTS